MIFAWVDEQIAGLDRYGVARVVTELDAGGRVMREIGFTSTGEVICYAPVAAGRFSWIFDGNSVDLGQLAAPSAMNALEFDVLWQAAVDLTAR